jgi:glyoxylase-like metal-dependent hydrolase (beta-lactamase superfamily II)
MRTTPFTGHHTQLTRLRFVNAYLVREADGFTLVDTTLKGAADDLIGAAREAGDEIRRIVLTHGHGDHSGGLDGLKERLGDAVQIFVPTDDERILAGEWKPEGKLPGMWPQVATRADVRLNAGDRVGSLEVVAAPGHTPGHVALLDTRDRTLLCGDTFTTMAGVAVTAKKLQRFPLAAMATWSPDLDRASARTLRALDPARLAPGHGPVVEAPAEAMDRAIAKS